MKVDFIFRFYFLSSFSISVLTVVYVSGFFLREKIKRIRIALASGARVFKTAEWHVEIAHEKTVNPYIAGLNGT